MKQIISNLKKIKISDNKILNFIKKCNLIGIIFCLFSFLFTYYYFILLQKNILFLGFFLFEIGLSIFIGGLISAIIINNN